MKKLRMFVTFVIVIAIVSSAFAFNAKKIATYCVSADSNSHTCSTKLQNVRIVVVGGFLRNYVPNWDGSFCGGINCNTLARFDSD
jgi:hypothetical protein